MNRVEADKYLVLIRDDYLYGLGQHSKTRPERDRLIQKAVEDFLEINFEERKEIIRKEQDRVHILFKGGHPPPYRMYLESVHIPDELVIRMEQENRYPHFDAPIYDALGTVLNAAIKVYLEKNYPDYLTA